MTIFNGKMNSKRFTMAVIGYFGTLAVAILKHWLTNIDSSLVITAAGIVTIFLGAQAWRPSDTTTPGGTKQP